MGNEQSPGPIGTRRRAWRRAWAAVCIIVVVAWMALPGADGVSSVNPAPGAATGWMDIVTPHIMLYSAILLLLSAFFSASEVAFCSLHQVRLRNMRESDDVLRRMVAGLMADPVRLLTTILTGNCIVNILLGVVLAPAVEQAFAEVILPPAVASPALSYALAVFVTTMVLVFFGEMSPKVLVLGQGEGFAQIAVLPMLLFDRLLSPLHRSAKYVIDLLFRALNIGEVAPAPFMTDDEFKSLLSEGEAVGVIEEDERQMIQGVLESSDVMLRDILVPRPDMLTLHESATMGEALSLIREHEIARVPVYREHLDDMVGVLNAKDLLPHVYRGELDRPITALLRKAHYVPETMTVADFVKTAQRIHAHLVIVVDEFGGTEGLVTLNEALREVVGDMGDQEEEEPAYRELAPGVYSVSGSFPANELEELTGIPVEAEDHATVAGFFMEQTDCLPQVGDQVEVAGVRYAIEALDDKRVARVRIEAPVKEETS